MSTKTFTLAIAALVCSKIASAQHDSTTASELNEVVVTATKFPKSTTETGKVVTIITRATLDRSLGKDLSQVLTEQAGLVINGATSNPGKDKSVYLRGAKNDYTVILINGIPVTDPSGVGGAFDLRMIPIEQIERIEILKGAQSTLYGSDAIAGVINIITRKGAGAPVQLSGNLSAGSYGTKRAYAGLSGQTEKTSYSMGFTHHEATGISEAKDTTVSKTFDKDGFQQHAFQFNLDAEVLHGLHVKPFFRYTFFKGGFDNGSFSDAANEYRSVLLSTGTIAQYTFGKGFVNAQYAHDEVNRTYNSTYGSTPYTGRNNLAEVFAQYNLGDKIQLLGGIDHRVQMVSDTNASPKDPSVRITSPYLSVYLKNLGGFNLETGVRYNKHSRYGDNFTYSINPSYVVSKRFRVFASLATAFKAPAISSLYGKYGANPLLKPERSKTYEGGFEGSLGGVSLRAVYFNRDTRNVVIYGPAFTYINLDRQQDQGVEIEPTITITDKLQVKLYYTFISGQVTTRAKTAGKDTSYNNLIRRPKQTFGMTAGYQVTPKLYVSTSVYAYGKRNDIFFNNATFRQQPVVLKAYALWNAYAEYGFFKNRLRVFADLKNITNTKYDEVYGYSTTGFNINSGIAFRL